MTDLLFPRSFIGFDKLINDMEKLSQSPSYPPHSIVEYSEENKRKYKISVAVAGFSKDEIEVTHQDSYVFIKGNKEKHQTAEKIIFSNFSTRNFHLKFKTADKVEVENVKLENGVLEIELVDNFKTPEIKKFLIK